VLSLCRRASNRCRVFAWTFVLFLLAGCGNTTTVDDPQLKQVQEMLDAQLPPGTPSALVTQFVNARGYPIEASGRTDMMVVVIRHIDPEHLKPVTARVTFHFDSNDKLLKTDIVRVFNQNPIPAPSQPEPQPQSQPESPPPPQQ
jgi:hypothetical protein